jgi:hypothetical protein
VSSLSSLTVSKQHLRKVPAMTEIVTVRNGIDLDQQLATIDAIKDDLNVASFTFPASSRCQEGIHNVGEIGRLCMPGRRTRAAASVLA